mmetsp:Transcript_101494/g.302763  ORF Transcript_101494/g.302763 Transcript_101494/m.302763 type:complete len:253 (+) Transcript_101494:179-937(+)
MVPALAEERSRGRRRSSVARRGGCCQGPHLAGPRRGHPRLAARGRCHVEAVDAAPYWAQLAPRTGRRCLAREGLRGREARLCARLGHVRPDSVHGLRHCLAALVAGEVVEAGDGGSAPGPESVQQAGTGVRAGDGSTRPGDQCDRRLAGRSGQPHRKGQKGAEEALPPSQEHRRLVPSRLQGHEGAAPARGGGRPHSLGLPHHPWRRGRLGSAAGLATGGVQHRAGRAGQARRDSCHDSACVGLGGSAEGSR